MKDGDWPIFKWGEGALRDILLSGAGCFWERLRRKQSAQQYQMIQRLDYMENNNFSRLLSHLTQNNNFTQAIHQANQTYFIKSYKISEFNPIIVADLYHTLQQKFYMRRTKPNEESWFENELRIFIWLLLGYLYVHNKSLHNMNQADWEYFVPIFNYRAYTFFEYQSLSLLRQTHKAPKWTPEEAALLQQIIQSKNYRNKWNSIARQLYNRSNKKYYRNPKQCREHWMNHLDPVKLHSGWTQSEDLTLMTTVHAHGKKWSLVVKKLLNTRTEHMVKNRYKSLISNQLKKNPTLRSNEVETYIINKLEKNSKSAEVKQEEDNYSQNSASDVVQQPKQLEESIKPSKPWLRKASNASEQGNEDAPLESPKMIELSESDFLNSPLPIPWSGQNFNENDSIM